MDEELDEIKQARALITEIIDHILINEEKQDIIKRISNILVQISTSSPKDKKKLWEQIFNCVNILKLKLTDETTEHQKTIIEKLEKLIELLPEPYKSKLGEFKNSLRVFINQRIDKIKEISKIKISDKFEKVKEEIFGLLNQKVSETDKIQNSVEEILTDLGNYLEENKSKIIESIEKAVTFEIDYNKQLISVPMPRIVLWDANFVKDIFNLGHDKTFYKINLAGEHIFLKSVVDELTYRLGGRIALVGNNFINYLRSFSEFKEENLVASSKEESDIYSEWNLSTKGATADFEKFKETGDFEILLFCYRETSKPIVILSKDSEIIQTVQAFKRKPRMNNVNVYSLFNEELKSAA